jgi:hypothetical protein
MAAEWFYLNSSGSYQWSVNCIKFEVTTTRYYSYSHYQNNDAFSTNTSTITCGTGEWMVQQWNPTTARVSGAKYISLDGDYYFVVTIRPKAHGDYRASYYGQFNPFDWDGEEKTVAVDLTYPGDG